MQTIDGKMRETLLAELELHKAEFSSLKGEIGRWLESERQLLNLSVVAFGAGIGFTQLITNPQSQIVLLLVPLVFHVFFREMLDCTRHVADISTYLMETLIPRVNQILDQLGADHSRGTTLGWEYRSANDPFNMLYFVVQPQRYWLPVSAVVGILFLYIANIYTYNYTPPVEQIVLVVINIIFLILTLVWGIRFFRNFKKHSDSLRKKFQLSIDLTANQRNKIIK